MPTHDSKNREQLILIVDDEPRNIRILNQSLGPSYLTKEAKTGEEALTLLDCDIPDLILLDVMLPEMSGFEICKVLKSNPETNSIPVIFLTARAMPVDIKEALSLGAVGYLAKPFDPMTLVTQINEILSPLGTSIGA